MTNKKLSQFIPKGRIKSLDILRGLAIIAMTLPHQTLPFGLQNTVIGHQLFIIGAYYTRPLFITVSGIALVFQEQKYRCPFRMIVHGSVLFIFAWCVDVITHQNFGIDWDIFQLIGSCYAMAGLFSYIGNDYKKYLGILTLILIWYIFAPLRPDQGLFPVWPNGIYFLCGYLIGKWGISKYNRFGAVLLIFIGSLIYLSCFYIYFERAVKLSLSPIGIAASLSAVFVLLVFALAMERKQLARKFPLSFILRFGIYPVSLYYMQQFFVVFGLKINLKLALTGISSIDCILHTTLLLLGMYLSTYLFDRLKFFSVEFWLRKAEGIIMDFTPAIGVFRPLPSKGPVE